MAALSVPNSVETKCKDTLNGHECLMKCKAGLHFRAMNQEMTYACDNHKQWLPSPQVQHCMGMWLAFRTYFFII